MKILYTATVLSHICQFHLPHMQHLQERGWEVHVAAHDNRFAAQRLRQIHRDAVFSVTQEPGQSEGI